MASQYHVLDATYARVQQLISSCTNTKSETIKLYGKVLKINRRNKKQNRTLVITDKAIYNIKNNSIKQRIGLRTISAITTSSKCTEFTVHIPSEYDYRYYALDMAFQKEIVSVICEQIINLNHEIFLNQINDPSTRNWTVTKKVLKTVNSHHDITVRTVMALDVLQNMGFKSKAAQKALKQNKMDLSFTILALISGCTSEMPSQTGKPIISPFLSRDMPPKIIKINRNTLKLTLPSPTSPISENKLSPTCSSTDTVDDSFVLHL